MARMARVIAPGYPHHVVQRGNRRQSTFFCHDDYRFYFDLLVEAKHSAGIEVWAYCFMPNHVHFVVVPEHADSLRLFFSEAHRRYTRRINTRNNWRGHLWQERFHSFVMDQNHLDCAVRYVELNPLRSKLCAAAEGWHWSSAGAHLLGRDNGLVSVEPMLARFSDWRTYLAESLTKREIDSLRKHTRTGRPSPDDGFVEIIEALVGRSLRKKKPGRK